MNDRVSDRVRDRAIPRIALVLGVGAAFTITMAGIRSVSGIIGPAFLALVLTITVHSLRRWLRRWRLPEWAASTIMLVAAYLLIIVLSLMLVVSLGRLGTLRPRYSDQIAENLDDLGSRLQDVGVGDEQVRAVVGAFDVGDLLAGITDLLAQGVGPLWPTTVAGEMLGTHRCPTEQ